MISKSYVNIWFYLQLYGIETRKGEIIWQLRVPSIQGFTKRSNAILLYVQRGSRHFPYPPQCALLAQDKVYFLHVKKKTIFSIKIMKLNNLF